MEWLAYVTATLFFVLGAGCVLLLVVQAPGTWVLLALAVLLEWLDRFYLPEGAPPTFGWPVLAACLALAVVGELVEFFAGAVGAQRGGSSRRGMWGALIGGLVGIFVFTPLFFFVPIFGALFGALLGTFVGAVVGELSHQRSRQQPRNVRGSLKPALWATVGRVVGATSKVGIGIAMWLTLTVSAYWR